MTNSECARGCGRAAYRENLCKPHYLVAHPDLVRVSATRSRDHLNRCLNQGATRRGIALSVGVPVETVRQVANGTCRRVTRGTQRKLLSATSEMAMQAPAWPTTRRIRALRAAGWSIDELAELTGLHYETVVALGQERYSVVGLDLAATVRRVYQECGLRLRPGVDPNNLVNGWTPPAGWADVDDPNETHEPVVQDRRTARSVQVTPELLLDLDRLVTCAGGWHRAAQALGVTKEYLRRVWRGSRTTVSPALSRKIAQGGRG